MKHIQMKRTHEYGAVSPGMRLDFPTTDSAKSVRSTLIMLFAGSAASKAFFEKDMKDIDKDWAQAAVIVKKHFADENPKELLPPRIGFSTPRANTLVREALENAEKLVRNDKVKTTIETVADLLLAAEPDTNGFCVVSAHDICLVCEQQLGSDFLNTNSIAGWINRD